MTEEKGIVGLDNEQVVVRAIVGYDNYGVAADGRVWSFNSGKWLKPFLCLDAHRTYVKLYNEGKGLNKPVDELVAYAWVGGYSSSYCCVSHKNFDYSNNAAKNLEWTTSSAKKPDLTDEVKPITVYLGYKTKEDRTNNKPYMLVKTQKAAGQVLGVNPSLISKACSDPNRSAGGYYWIKTKIPSYVIEQKADIKALIDFWGGIPFEVGANE